MYKKALEILKQLDYLSLKIIKESLEYLNELKNDSNDLLILLNNEIERNYEEFKNLSTDERLEYLRDASLELIHDADRIQKELTFFRRALKNDDFSSYKSFPFLAKVWFGDTYDDEKEAGLLSLQSDLEETYSQLDEDGIIRQTLSLLSD